MANFYGTLRGSGKKGTTRVGSKKSGLISYCASWSGAVRCEAYVNANGEDCVSVELIPWMGKGRNKLLYNGPFDPEGKNEKATAKEITRLPDPQ